MDDPFLAFKIDSLSVLSTIQGRTKCPSCQASRKWFCYSCFVPVDQLKGKIPKVELPIKVIIIKHPKEIEGKSTAVHAALLAPDNATVTVYPEIPEFTDPSKVVLVFPSKDAIKLEDLVQQHYSFGRTPNEAISDDDVTHSFLAEKSEDSDVNHSAKRLKKIDDEDRMKGDSKVIKKYREYDKTEIKTKGNGEDTAIKIKKDSDDSMVKMKRGKEPPFNHVVFIDSTWAQTNKIIKDVRLQGIQRVILKPKKTLFWRTQHGKPDSYLATIEAVYYFMCEYHKLFINREYAGEYDNLLYFFKFFYNVVTESNQNKNK